MRFVNKHGDILYVRIRSNYKSLRKTYHLYGMGFDEYIKALNLFNAVIKFSLRHPLILFRVDTSKEV